MDTEDERLVKVRELLETIRGGLLSMVDAGAISDTAKVPYKVVCYREGLGWRIEELGRCACDSYVSGDIATAITLTRGVAETAAAAWYLKELIEKQLSEGLQPDFDDKVMALLMGHRNTEDMPKAVNVITFIQRLDKLLDGFESTYNQMSEVAHPNWAGTQLLFSRVDKERRTTCFGRNLPSTHAYERIGVTCLLNALLIFDHCYEKSCFDMISLVRLCEEHLASKE